MAGGECLETPLVRVPFEALRKTSRDRKYLVDEVASLLSVLKDRSASPNASADAAELLDTLLARVQSLKRKADDNARLEEQDAQRCRARLHHLTSPGSVTRDSAVESARPRLDRLLADHLLRSGYTETAVQLAQEAGVEELVDTHIFAEVQPVMAGLRRQDCAAALTWCTDNQAKLKKIKSKLEFRLRVQEFVELVRCDEMLPALRYAREHLAPHAVTHMAELQQATAILALRKGTGCQPYAALFNPRRWKGLLDLFLQDLYRLHSLPARSLFEVHLQAGLSALKTPQSYRAKGSKEDPLHHHKFQRLAEGLPRAKHVHSKLVCHVTSQIMDEHNLPMVMPNGTVYSEAAVRLLTGPDNRTFTCPKSGISCDISDLQRAFMS